MPAETTEITVMEDGSETHESWLRLTTSRVSSTGTTLFDSELAHRHYVKVTINRCKRERRLNHDSIFMTERIAEIEMSMAQWGAFVSSFGEGGGVSATLTWLDGPVAAAPHESRLAVSAREVRDAGGKALAEIRDAYDKLAEAFERGAGKREMRALMHDLDIRMGNAPANMQFAADTLTKHTENVVTKARADIEAMIASMDAPNDHALDSGAIRALAAPAEPDTDDR